jgi:hypothetical protein
MIRKIIIALLAVVAVASASDAKRRRHPPRLQPSQGIVNIPCDPDIKKIEDCSDVGCSNERSFEADLNKQKNIRTSNQTPIDKDFSFLVNRPNPGSDFVEGGSREALTALGEGQMIRVVAFAVGRSQRQQGIL